MDDGFLFMMPRFAMLDQFRRCPPKTSSRQHKTSSRQHKCTCAPRRESSGTCSRQWRRRTKRPLCGSIIHGLSGTGDHSPRMHHRCGTSCTRCCQSRSAAQPNPLRPRTRCACAASVGHQDTKYPLLTWDSGVVLPGTWARERTRSFIVSRVQHIILTSIPICAFESFKDKSTSVDVIA